MSRVALRRLPMATVSVISRVSFDACTPCTLSSRSTSGRRDGSCSALADRLTERELRMMLHQIDGMGQNPMIDSLYLAGFFGYGDEAVWGYQVAVGVAHSQQRLRTSDLSGGHV